MALIVKHEFVSAKGDGADATQVQPSNWNAAHTLSGSLATAQVDGLDAALAAKVSSASLVTALGAYITSGSLAADVTARGFITSASASAAFVTSASLATTLATYILSSSLATALATYITSASLSADVVSRGFITSASVGTALATYITSASLSADVQTRGFLSSLSASAAYELKDADILRADTTDQLVAGYTAANDDDGIYPDVTATYVADVATGNFKEITNGGAFTLKPPSPVNDEWAVVDVYIVNAADAGAITVTPFTKTTGDAFTTTDTHKFIARITVADIGGTEYSHLDVVALQ